MFIKWYLGLCFCISLFLGTFDYTNTSANQELVLHFTKAEISSVEAQQTIVKLKERLKEFGVHIVKIDSQNNSHLRIQYYSDSEITDIEAFFNVDYSDFYPSSENDNSTTDFDDESLSLDFYEIQGDGSSSQGFNGVQVETYQTKTDRLSLETFNWSSLDAYQLSKGFYQEKEALLTFQNPAKKTISFQIPQVRAGPVL